MNDMQKKFFKHIADIQETCVEICLSKHKKYNDNEARAMLYNKPMNLLLKLWK